jgi:hypothetical protein
VSVIGACRCAGISRSSYPPHPSQAFFSSLTTLPLLLLYLPTFVFLLLLLDTPLDSFKMAPKIAIVYYSMYGHIKKMVC